MCYPIHKLNTYTNRAGACAAALLLAGTSAASAIQVNLDAAAQTYDGGSKPAAAATVPAGFPVDLTYRALTHPSVPESDLVFDNTPAILAPSYSSVSFSSNRICGMGNYLQLGGTSRQIQSIEVTMVTWAAAVDYPLMAAANSAGYTHPITISLYQFTDAHQLVFLTEIEKQILIPWRPATLSNGNVYPYNGYAFQAAFDFTGTAALPEKVLALVSFDTGRAGFVPIGIPGPYDQLNIALTSAAPATGADADPSALFKVEFDPLVTIGRWTYPDSSVGTKCPMMRVRTLSTRSKTPPKNAGTYEVYATISGTNYPGGVVGNFTIDKAQATVDAINTSQFYTGGGLDVPVSTLPVGLPVTVTYNNNLTPPSAVGSYQVSAAVADPNYTGQGNSVLTIKPSVRSWIDAKVASGEIVPEMAGNHDDPDGDGISNLMEYAANSDPSVRLLTDVHGPLMPRLLASGNIPKFVYRRNLEANDLNYAIESGASLSNSDWQPTEGTESILSDDGHTQVVEVSFPPSNSAKQFYRLKVSR